jgi:P27 family predicted phage terminase small subunit
MKRGPRPRPTKLKLLQGNPGKRPLNDMEPQPARIKPECPDFLSNRGRREWDNISQELFDLGLLTRIDHGALAAYCQAYAHWAEAEEDIAANGLIRETSTGIPVPNPAVGIAHRAMGLLRRFLVEFGMTPSARSRLTVGPPAGGNELDNFLNDDKKSHN